MATVPYIPKAVLREKLVELIERQTASARFAAYFEYRRDIVSALRMRFGSDAPKGRWVGFRFIDRTPHPDRGTASDGSVLRPRYRVEIALVLPVTRSTYDRTVADLDALTDRFLYEVFDHRMQPEGSEFFSAFERVEPLRDEDFDIGEDSLLCALLTYNMDALRQ